VKQHLLYLLVNLLIEEKEYSIEELKKILDMKKDKDLLRSLCGILLVSLNSICAGESADEYEYLLNCCNYIFDVIRQGKKLNIDAIKSNINDCRKILRNKAKLVDKHDDLWHDYFNQLKEKLSAIEIALSYAESQSISSNEYEFFHYIIFEDKEYNIVKTILQQYPSLANLLDEDNNSLFLNIINYYIKLVKEGTHEEEYQYFEKIIRLIWYGSKFDFKEEERAKCLKYIESVMNRHRITLSYSDKRNEKNNKTIIVKLQSLKDVLTDARRLLDVKRLILTGAPDNILMGGKFSNSIRMELVNIIKSKSTDDYTNRMNITNKYVVTIDCSGAESLDDALSLEKDGDDYILGIHIADVSYYVEENSLIDKEAFNRTSTIYLPNGIIPMIPMELGYNLCSLTPNANRRVISCFVRIDKRGNIKSYSFNKSVIKSKQKIRYADVCKIIKNDKTNPELRGTLKELLKLSHILQSKMNNKIINEETISDITGEQLIKTGDDAAIGAEMVATYMVLANQLVAAYFARNKLPFIYRVSADPNTKAMLKRKKYLDDMLESSRISSEEYNRLLGTIKLIPSESEYSTRNIGHYELCCDAYTNWTSPIRRYIDIVIERLMSELMLNPNLINEKDKLVAIWKEKLDVIVQQVNITQKQLRELDEDYSERHVKIIRASNN
jgi:hypothetical protein